MREWVRGVVGHLREGAAVLAEVGSAYALLSAQAASDTTFAQGLCAGRVVSGAAILLVALCVDRVLATEPRRAAPRARWCLVELACVSLAPNGPGRSLSDALASAWISAAATGAFIVNDGRGDPGGGAAP